jgi:hypothetical protein
VGHPKWDGGLVLFNLNTTQRTAINCCVHCRTLPRTQRAQYRVHCHTLPHTAAHCRTHCRTLPHYCTHCCTQSRTLLNYRTAENCRAHCHILPSALPHTTVRNATHYRVHFHTLLSNCHILLLALLHTATHYCTLPHCQRVYDFLIKFILVYFHKTHQVLVGLPEEFGGLAIFFYYKLIYFSLF